MSAPRSPNFNADLREPRIGVALHYPECDFNTAVAWCCTPKGPTNDNPVSYHAIIAGDGAAVQLVAWDARAWHMGVCKPSKESRSYEDANSAFYGIALAGGPTFGPPTSAQEQTLNAILYDRYETHQWPLAEWWRITSHSAEAWPRGRKVDPEGPDKAHPWLSIDGVRAALAATQP